MIKEKTTSEQGMEKATARPWKILDFTAHSPLYEHKITNKEGVDIAIVPHWYDDKIKEARANAILIVQAVNCHDELVEALTESLRFIPYYFPKLKEKCKQALAKAESE